MYYTIGRFFQSQSPLGNTLCGIHFLRPLPLLHIVISCSRRSPHHRATRGGRVSMTKEEKRTGDIQPGTSVDRRLRGHYHRLGILISVNCNKLPATMSLVIPRARHRHRHGGEHHVAQRLRRARHDLRRSRHHRWFGSAGPRRSCWHGRPPLGAVISAPGPASSLVVGRLIEGVGYACIGQSFRSSSRNGPAVQRAYPWACFPCGFPWVPCSSWAPPASSSTGDPRAITTSLVRGRPACRRPVI